MDYTEKDFGKILKSNALQIRRLMLKSDTTCMRVYDRNLERFPVTVDLYGPYARITDYSEDGLDEAEEQICCDIVSRMLYIQKDRVVYHRRPKRVGREQHTLQSEQSLEVQVRENGLLFTVDLTKRIDTGLFLDHMLTRQMVEKLSRGCRVLNLFSYTGAFSVYAARGGATKVESVDLSGTYTAWAERNLADNGYSGSMYPCITSDAYKYVTDALAGKQQYDLIIFDPPSFSNSRKMEHDFDVQRDYLRWLRVLNNLLTSEGTLVFSTNLGLFKMDKKAVNGFTVEEITDQVVAPGFSRRRGTSRTWLLVKQRDVRISASDVQPVMRTTDISRYEEEMEENNKMNDEQDLKEMEEMDGVGADESTQDEAVQMNAEVEDDLLTLHWDDEDIAPIAETKTLEAEPKKSEYERRDRSGERRGSYSREREDRRRSDDRPYSRERGERPSYGDRDGRRRSDDRPYSRERSERPSYGDRDDRRRSDDRPYSRERSERPSYSDRDGRRRNDDRPYSRERSERPSFGDRDGRRRFDDRPSFRDRSDRPSFRDRDDRPSFRDRDDRPSFRDRDDRPSFRDRDDRPSFRDREDRRSSDDRPSFSRERGERPAFRREEGAEKPKRERKTPPKPYGFDKFRETRTRGEHEDDNFFWLDKDDKDKQ